MSDIWENEPDLAQLRRAHGLLETAPAEALTELKALTDRGSSMSMMYLARAYREGRGTRVDLLQAEEWYRRAADGGVTLASYELGRMYLDAKQYVKAEEAFRVGASKNYAPSMNMLGTMYRDGAGVDRNIEKAKDFFEKASALGHVFSKRNLAALLIRGGFGPFQILRGFWLFLTALKDLVAVGTSDPISDRLR